MIDAVTAVGYHSANPLRHISLIPRDAPYHSTALRAHDRLRGIVERIRQQVENFGGGLRAADAYIRGGSLASNAGTYTVAGMLEHYRKMNLDPLSASYVDRDFSNLDNNDKARIQRMAARDQYVKVHEMRHAAVLGIYAGRIHYDYVTGPDGKAYAVGGYTEINTTPAPNTELAIAKARTIRAAAMAAGEASGSDRAVAAQALALERALLASA